MDLPETNGKEATVDVKNERNRKRYEAVMSSVKDAQDPVLVEQKVIQRAVTADKTQQILARLDDGQAKPARNLRTTRFKG